MKEENLIHQDLIPYFSEIAKRLWSGHAAVMVGAGFSRNAKKNSSTSKSFPDWDQLGNIFYDKVNGIIPDPENCNDSKYRNVLRLADEVQAAFGRGVLDNIIKNEIPDKEYQPSLLHEKLLQLPWVDVFTTNYDTLLERAAEKVLQQRYDTVVNTEDLVYSSKPRIIKLHGSFPSERPFVITEEDYRKYPKEFAPFVNTVQQALLENTLCLLGFSGTDPNFLKWIGWIRDNLGKENSPRIYLIGILNISSAQKKLLEQRNIISLDLSVCNRVENNHENAINLFLDFLSIEGKIDNRLDWPREDQGFHSYPREDNLSKVPEILENWISTRNDFPNWLIVPEDRRDILSNNTNDSFIFHLSKIDSPKDIQFLYEYNWRIEKCLAPIYDNLIPYYEQIINKYNPFPDQIIIENAITPQESKLDWVKIIPIWLELQLAIMRNFREEGMHEKWQQYCLRLSLIVAKLEPEMEARYYFERCLYSLFSLDIAGVRKELELWTTNNSLPYWEAKRAGILAEIGNVTEAEKILEDSLIEIRSRLNLTPVTNDYSNVSQEAYLMQLYRSIKFNANLLRGQFPLSADINNRFKERWNLLVQYKCDPWLEYELFELQLDRESIDYKSEESKYGFDVNSISTTYHFGGTDKYAQKAYSYLRFTEDIGIPLRLERTISEKAIRHIAKYSPFWAFTTFVRIGDVKLADYLFDRKSISKIDIEIIDNKINEYLAVLERSSDEIKKGTIFRNETFAINLSKVIPEILSRLCVKSSFELKIKLLNQLREIYNCEYKDRFNSIKNLTQRLIKSFSKSEQYGLIPQLLEFPILPVINHRIDDEYIDPFVYIELDKKTLIKNQKIKIEDVLIITLFEYAQKEGKEREIALRRLIMLWELDLLTKKQTAQLAKSLWDKIDIKNGFPTDLNYYYFSYINLPHPSTIIPEELLRIYINNIVFPIQTHDNPNQVSFISRDIQGIQEILGTSRTSVSFLWTEEALNILVEKVIIWWDADKYYLKKIDKPFIFGSVSNEFKTRFSNLISLYTHILGPNFKLLNSSNQKELQRILGEFEEYGIPDNEAYATFYNHFPIYQNKSYLKIYEGLFSKSEDKIIDSLRGIIKLVELNVGNVNALIVIISEQIRNRCEKELVSFLGVMTLVVKDHSDILSIDILNNLQLGLKNLITETVITINDTEEVVNDKISIKIKVANLTIALYAYFNKHGQIMPEYIEQWRDLCLDKNEFSEIRRIWIDALESN